MMTNREILSKINSDGGGVSFADGGDIPAKIHTTDKEYEYGGKMMHDIEIANQLGMNSTLKKGKQYFSTGGKTYDVDAIYNAIKKGKIRLKTKEVETFPMKYPVYDKNYAENHKIDFRKPNGITVRAESGEEVLIDGNHRMNNAYLKGKKTMKIYYIEDLKQISKFIKKNKFELGGENKVNANLSKSIKVGDLLVDNDDLDFHKKIYKVLKLDNQQLEVSVFENYKNAGSYVLPIKFLEDFKLANQEEKDFYNNYSNRNKDTFEKGGHLSKGKSLKQIAEMHNVSLAHINEQLAKGLEVEKEHFADFKERTRVAKDHLVENPNYYTILEKAGLEKGGKFDSKPFLDYYFEEIKDFLKYQNDIKLKDDFTFFYKGENFKIEPLILSDKEKKQSLQEASFIIIDQDDEEVGEIKFDTNSKQNKKFEAYSDFFEWNNIKFDVGGELKINHKKEESLVKDAKDGNTPARDLNNYNDLLDVQADGEVGGDSGIDMDGALVTGDAGAVGTFEDGGNIIYDANSEGDSVSVLSTGGGVDLIPVNSIIITRDLTVSKIYNDFVGTEYKSFDTFIDDLKLAIEKQNQLSPKMTNNGGFAFRVNENKPENKEFPLYFSDKKKNTVRNFNPKTGNTSDFKKQLDRSMPTSFKKYDWNGFLTGIKKSTTTNPIASQASSNSKFPEYYEYIGDKTNDFTKGKIYKIKNPSNLQDFGNFIDDTGSKNGFGERNHLYFKPSTEDAFLTQNNGLKNSKTHIFSKPIVESLVLSWIANNNSEELKQVFNLKEFFDLARNIFESKFKNVSITPYREYALEKPKEFNEKKIIDGVLNNSYNQYKETLIFELEHKLFPNLDFSQLIKRDTKISNDVSYVTVFYKIDGKEVSYGAIRIELLLDKLKEIKEKHPEIAGVYLEPTSLTSVLGKQIVYFTSQPILKNDLSVNINYKDFGKFLKDIFTNLFWDDFLMLKSKPPVNSTPINKKFDFSDTKIDVKDNPELSQKVQKRAFEEGWEWEKNGGKTIDYDDFNFLYFTKTSISKGNTSTSFINSPKREITEDDIFGSQAPTTSPSSGNTSTSSKDKVTQVKVNLIVDGIPYSFNDKSFELLKETFQGIELNFKNNPVIDVTMIVTFKDGNGGMNTTSKQRSFGDSYFKPSNHDDDSLKKWLNDDVFGKKYDFTEFFNEKSARSTSKPLLTDLSDTKIWIGDNPELSEKIQRRAFELGWDWVDKIKKIQETDRACMYFSGTNLHNILKSSNDRFDFDKSDSYREITVDDLFNSASQTNVSDKEKVKSIVFLYKKNGSSIVKRFDNSKDLLKEIKSKRGDLVQDAEIRINGENTSKSIAWLYLDDDNPVYPYWTMDLSEFEDILSSILFGEEYDWSDFFSDKKTSNPVVPKIEQEIFDLDTAISKLEKASSVSVKEYNTENYELSLKFLYETKASYELALKFTPESAFLYERLDIMKKLADVEKSIKKIEDMKKGGAYYILAQMLEKLQRGESWKLMENTQDVITNKIPQSEIDSIIRSQNFINWFGDWEKALVTGEYDNVSKALTDGIPSVYHHGAKRIKYTYREVSNGVLYLAENVSYALWFSQNSFAQSIEGNYLTECFVNIKNPIDLTAFHVKKIDLGDLVKYIDAIYPLTNIYNFIPSQLALLIKSNQPTNIIMWAWELIRKYSKFVNYIKESTPYDGFLYYENNPSDQVINPATGQLEENVTKAVAIFKSPQVKVVDAVLFDGGLDDWRFENGGKLNN